MAAPGHAPEGIEREWTHVLPPSRVLIHDDPLHTAHEVALAIHRTVPGTRDADGWASATLVATTGQAVAAIGAQDSAADDHALCAPLWSHEYAGASLNGSCWRRSAIRSRRRRDG